jgi:hypothetical protein
MSEELFYSEFSQKLADALNSLRPYGALDNLWAKDLYLSKWIDFRDSMAFDDAIVSCDGSVADSSFSGGLTVWYARALAHIYRSGESLTPLPVSDVRVGYRMKGKTLFMRTLELRALRYAVEKCLKSSSKEILALYDGNLYLTFLHHPPYLEQMVDVLEAYVRELRALLTMVLEHDVKLIGISKDSDARYVRARLLLEALMQEDVKLGYEVARERSVVRIAEKLKSLVGLVNESKKAMLENFFREFNAELSDEELYDIIAKGPGFTRPLVLSPQTFYISEEVKAGTTSWWDSVFRARIKQRESLAPVTEALDDLYRLPPVSVLYWRPHHGLGIYRLDIPSSLLGISEKWGDIGGDRFIEGSSWLDSVKTAVSILNGLSPEPYFVKPLMEVDQIVRLDRKLYSQVYEPVLTAELRKRGLRAMTRKRRIRDLVIRGVL